MFPGEFSGMLQAEPKFTAPLFPSHGHGVATEHQAVVCAPQEGAPAREP